MGTQLIREGQTAFCRTQQDLGGSEHPGAEDHDVGADDEIVGVFELVTIAPKGTDGDRPVIGMTFEMADVEFGEDLGAVVDGLISSSAVESGHPSLLAGERPPAATVSAHV